jgi:glycogen phosphorylase
MTENSLPELTELSADLWSAADPDAQALIARAEVDPTDPGLPAAAAAQLERLHTARAAQANAAADLVADGMLVAYFSCEFGLAERLAVYSGGLGVLAGDHLKAAADIGVPLVGVGLFYATGYFRQGVDSNGWQVERYPVNNPDDAGLELCCDAAGTPIEVTVGLPDGPARLRIHKSTIGEVSLYLLDADHDGNPESIRRITGALYGGDREMRIRQEVLLGVGGVRALRALGLAPTVWHMNEGHSAFLALERLRELVSSGVSYGAALERVRAGGLFTTHTPVPAGNEVFDTDLVVRYMGSLAAEAGLDEPALRALGLFEDPAHFSMTVLALKTASRANGVSALHGEVSREMWRGLWPDLAEADVPIGHVTNGVHVGTWLSPELASLVGGTPGAINLEAIRRTGDADIWAAHQAGRARLVADVARRLGADRLDPEALTIGFSRRFTAYKRATLLFRDPERLVRLVSGDPTRPVQFLFAGKAHPADEEGKRLIQQVIEFCARPDVAGRIVFLVDYEMDMARHLIQGVDIWLNTPRRPLEASGTSGMKAALNGALNLSILDGWWAEGYAPEVGWAIGDTTVDPDTHAQDSRDADSLYRLLEDEIVPLFHHRGADGVPTEWVAKMRESIARLGALYSTGRMVSDYRDQYYLPAHRDPQR